MTNIGYRADNMMISQTFDELLLEKIQKQGARVDEVERIFYIQEGTEPTAQMKALKMQGWKGQFEIR